MVESDRGKKKLEGLEFSISSGSVLQYDYHPGKRVYTGATVGGVTTGGVHQAIALNVNRNNSSVHAYKALDYHVAREERKDGV